MWIARTPEARSMSGVSSELLATDRAHVIHPSRIYPLMPRRGCA